MTIAQIKYLVIVIIVAITTYALGYKIYNFGYETAEQKYTKVIAEYNQKQITASTELESRVTSLILATASYNNKLSEDINGIRKGLQGKTLVVYKDGKCVLSQEFIDSRTAAINRANQK